MVKVDTKKLSKIWDGNRRTILIVGAALLLTIALLAVRAGSPFAGFEAEGGNLGGNAVVKSESGVSGGSFVEFTAGTTQPDPDCSGITINPGDNWQSKVDAAGTGATFCVKAGVHRMQSVTAKSGQKFIGQSGAIMSGARLLTGWQQSGSDWYVGGQTQGLSSSGYGPCRSGEPRCGNPENLFVNDQRLTHVASRSDLGPGKWFFDYTADRIYMRDNPSGKTVETSVLSAGFMNGPSDLVIRNLIIEKYATPNQFAAVGNNGGTGGWLIENNEIRFNHAVGVRGATGTIIRNNDIHHNGMLGAAGGANHLFENNKVHHNAAAGWGGFGGGYSGGSKWTHANGMIIRGNHHYDNGYVGLWADGNNINMLIENNIVENSTHHGLFYEIGHKAIIRNNISRNNGWGGGYWADRAGIMLNTSQDVEIYGNTVENNYNGIALVGWDRSGSNSRYGDYVNRNNKIYNNTVTMDHGYTGAHGGNTEWNTIDFYNNTYRLKGGTGYFRFNGISRDLIYDWNQWRGAGQGSGSTYTTF